jgi:hypothetical protein
MTAYEYRVVPAPAKGKKAKGVKTPEERFALALEDLMNVMGADGWEYQRADTLPSTERTGLTGSTTNWRHVLVFRRAVAAAAERPSSPAEWPAPPTDFSPGPGERETVTEAPPEEDRPQRPTLVASRNDPADSGV